VQLQGGIAVIVECDSVTSLDNLTGDLTSQYLPCEQPVRWYEMELCNKLQQGTIYLEASVQVYRRPVYSLWMPNSQWMYSWLIFFYGLHLLAPDMLNHTITWIDKQSRAKCPELPFLAFMPVPILLFRMGKDHTFGIPKAENIWISVQASLEGMYIV